MLTDYTAKIVLKELCGKGPQNYATRIATNAYLGLSSTQPQANGQGVTEPTGNGYSRKLIGVAGVSASQLMADPETNTISNTNEEIHFNKATGDWGECLYVCIFDKATGGNLLAYGQLTGSISPVANTVPVIEKGAIILSLT